MNCTELSNFMLPGSPPCKRFVAVYPAVWFQVITRSPRQFSTLGNKVRSSEHKEIQPLVPCEELGDPIKCGTLCLPPSFPLHLGNTGYQEAPVEKLLERKGFEIISVIFSCPLLVPFHKSPCLPSFSAEMLPLLMLQVVARPLGGTAEF